MKRIICTYWEGLTMVAREGCYYATPFKGSRGVTQGNIISPTIFNILVDVVIRHWEMVMAEEEEVPERFGRAVQNLAVLFYADEGILSSQWPSRIQETLDFLMGIFDRVGMRKYIDKMAGMVCQPCSTAGRKSEVA